MKFATCHPDRKHESHGLCKTCSSALWRKENLERWKEYQLKWRKEHSAQINERTRKKRLENREQINAKNREWFKNHPGMSAEYHRKVRYKKAGRPMPEFCEVCGKTPSPSTRLVEGKMVTIPLELHYDHDHATGHFRGWLCHKCNFALGNVNDSPELLRKLADYLENQEMPATDNYDPNDTQRR